MPIGVFQPDFDESFPRLKHAPIVEAYINWQALAQQPLEPDSVRTALTQRLPSYPILEPIRRADHTRHFWGWRLSSHDGLNVIQFKRDGLICSRLKPYDNWQTFSTSAMQAWMAYVDLAMPLQIQHLGVRFINHLHAVTAENLQDYLREPPGNLFQLPLKEHACQNLFTVPGYPFTIHINQLLQRTIPELQPSSGLFLDIQVNTLQTMATAPDTLSDILEKLRWLKNKAFFTLLTENAIRSFA